MLLIPGALPPVTLGEGYTPLIRLRDAPDREGGPAGEVWLKYEGGSPTGSHKDRAMAVGVAAAVAAGADTVVAASSGNAGAAYAARAGLRCVVFTNEAVPTGLRPRSMRWAPSGWSTRAPPRDRNAAMARAVQKPGWHPLTSYSAPSTGGKPRGGREGPRPPRPAQRFSGPARCRAMTIRWIWLVPSTIWRTLASRI